MEEEEFSEAGNRVVADCGGVDSDERSMAAVERTFGHSLKSGNYHIILLQYPCLYTAKSCFNTNQSF